MGVYVRQISHNSILENFSKINPYFLSFNRSLMVAGAKELTKWECRFLYKSKLMSPKV